MTAARCDAAPPGGLGGQKFRLAPFGLGHRTDHRFDLLELLLALFEHAVIDLVHAGDHLHQSPQRAHALDQPHLLKKIREVEAGLLELLLHLGHIGQLHFLGGLLHQGEHIAHAEDAAGHALGVEGLQGLHLLAGADELDRRTAHLADREGGAAPGIAIQLGEHRTGDPHLLMESAGEVGRLLANHRIHHQQHLIGLAGLADPHHLLHHRRIDLEAAGGVHQHGVEPLRLRPFNAGGGDGLGGGFGAQAEHLHPDLTPQGAELLDGGRTVHIGTHHQSPAALLLEVQAQLGGGGGLAGALEARHQHHGGFSGASRRRQGGIGPPHRFHQLLMHQLNELLVGTDAPHHFRTDRLAAHLVDEVLDHRQAHIRLEQGAAHLLEGPLHVGLGDRGLAPQPLDRVLKPLG